MQILNFLILQWFFIRIVRVHNEDDQTPLGVVLTGFILPLTGWSKDWIRIGKEWCILWEDK